MFEESQKITFSCNVVDFLQGLVFIVMDILKMYLVYFKGGAAIVRWGGSHVINTVPSCTSQSCGYAVLHWYYIAKTHE